MNAASGSSIIGQHARHGCLLELSEAAAIGVGGRGRELAGADVEDVVA